MSELVIKAQELVKSFPNNHKGLDGISFEVKEGEFLVIIGSSGAGKSTLIRTLIADEKPTSGAINVLGYNLGKIPHRNIYKYRHKVGIVFQDFKLLPKKTVYENVAFALEVSGASNRYIRAVVPKIIHLVELSGKENNFPGELSGGEQQRVAIARAMVIDPKILIADEPTGNLDPVTTVGIINLLLKINKLGTTVILATHDDRIVNKLKKRVITLSDGKIKEDQKVGKYKI